MKLHTHGRLRRSGLSLTVALAVGLLAQGCGGDAKPAPSAAPSASTDSATLLDRALKASAAGDTAAAQRDFEALRVQDPANKLAPYNLGVLAQQAGDDNTAAARYDEALKIDPAYEPALYNLAILTNKRGDAQGAADLYERAIQADPGDANAHYNLGLLLRRLGDAGRGDAEIKKAIKLDPSLKRPAASPSATG